MGRKHPPGTMGNSRAEQIPAPEACHPALSQANGGSCWKCVCCAELKAGATWDLLNVISPGLAPCFTNKEAGVRRQERLHPGDRADGVMLAANPHLGPHTWCFPDTTCPFSQTRRAPPVPVPLGYNVLFQGFTWFHVYLLSLSHVCDGAFANTEELSTWTPGRCRPRSKMEERGLPEVSVMCYTFKRRLKDEAVN